MDNGETDNIGYKRQKTKKMSNQDPIKIRVNTGGREE